MTEKRKTSSKTPMAKSTIVKTDSQSKWDAASPFKATSTQMGAQLNSSFFDSSGYSIEDEAIRPKELIKFEKPRSKYLFGVNSSFKHRFDMLIVLFALFNTFMVPLKVSFNPEFLESPIITIINGLTDFSFMLDMIFSFRTVIFLKNGDEIDQPCEIATRYLKTTFFIDLIATVPMDLVAKALLIESSSLQMFRLLKLGRILRINKLVKYL